MNIDNERLRHKRHLGDGVYASFDGYQIWLHVSNGISFYNPIALEAGTFNQLAEYAAQVFGRREKDV